MSAGEHAALMAFIGGRQQHSRHQRSYAKAMSQYSAHGLLYWFCKHSGVSVLDSEGQAEQNRDRKVRKAESHIQRRSRSHRLRVARKGQRRNLRPRPPRKKDWAVQPREWDDSDHELRERIMPIDERDRRRALEKAVLGATESEAEST